ncbi:MAG: DUF488 domain-containing protein [Pirellulales bacterium]|nr:DUF488 domain-containing protein [Pirellulales bacterium]
MARESSSGEIFTIGHSNHSPEFFLELLAGHGVEVVVDVRSSPYARYSKHFNRQPLEKLLCGSDLKYLFLGDVLGGRPQGHEFYDEQGYVLYDRLASSPSFVAGIERLLQAARISCICLLCGEEDPSECHRRLLLGRVLSDHGVEVLHIRGDGRTQSEAELTEELQFQKTKGQMTLFDTDEPKEWKSTQSVLPKEPPASFTMPGDDPELCG